MRTLTRGAPLAVAIAVAAAAVVSAVAVSIPMLLGCNIGNFAPADHPLRCPEISWAVIGPIGGFAFVVAAAIRTRERPDGRWLLITAVTTLLLTAAARMVVGPLDWSA